MSIIGSAKISGSGNILTYVSPNTQDLSLIYYYRFEFSDISGTLIGSYVNNTTTYNATLYNGASISSNDYKTGNRSLYLSAASSQYVNINPFTTGINGITVACWFRSNNTGNWGRIMDFGNGPNSNTFLISVNGNNSNKLYFAVSNNGTEVSTTTNYSPNNNTWIHLVWTMTYATSGSSTCIWNVYINGALYGTYNNKYYPQPVSRSNNYLGRSNWTGDSYYNGYIDDFKMYNRILSLSDVNKLYSAV